MNAEQYYSPDIAEPPFYEDYTGEPGGGWPTTLAADETPQPGESITPRVTTPRESTKHDDTI